MIDKMTLAELKRIINDSEAAELHEYIEDVMGEPIFTHQLGSEEFNKVLRDKLKPKILELIQGIV